MKTSKKVLAILLTIATLIGIFSCATPVLATEVTEIPENQSSETTLETSETTENEETVKTEEAEILYEDISLRDEHTKHFVMSNGLNRAVRYAQPIHYKEKGEWVNIDNTLEYNKETEKYENKANSFKVNFDKKFDSEQLFTIENKGYTMSWRYSGNAMRNNIAIGKIEKHSSKKDESEKHQPKPNGKIKYDKFESDCNLEYIVTGTGVKENIILESYTGKNKFSFEVTAKNLGFIKNEDKSISVVKQSGEEIFYIPAPFMYDGNNNYSYDVEYSIETKKGKTIISVIADKAWLENKGTKYPVTIDPVIETEKTKTAIETTFVARGKPTTNYNGVGDIYIGVDSYAYDACQTLVKFELPTLKNSDMVVGATLGLWMYNTSFYLDTMPDKQINVHTITTEWDIKNVTWNTKPQIAPNVSDYNFIKKSDASYSKVEKGFDVTRTVKEWYEGTIPNNGFLIKAEEEDGSYSEVAARAVFRSDNYENKEYMPYIAIVYRNNKGIESYWDYSTYGIGAAGTAYVNDYTGNLVYELPIASSISEIMPVSIAGYYNNYCAKKLICETEAKDVRTSIGRGFRLFYQQTVLPSTKYGLTGDNAETYPYVYTDGDGTEHYIQKVTEDGKTVYKDEEGLGLTFTTDCDETATYQITDKAHNNYYFNSKGNLGIIKDKNGNKITIKYKAENEADGLENKSRIDKIIDGAGHTYKFTYYIKSSTGVELDYVEKITDDAGRVVYFDISGGLLNYVSYYTGDEVDIVYENTTEGIINYIQSNKSYRLNFNYTSKATGRRVKTVTEYGVISDGETISGTTKGQVITFDRSQYNTTVMRSCGMDGTHGNADDIITTVQYDNMGRAISQQTKFGSGDEIGAGSVAYTTSDSDDSAAGFKNKVSGSGATGKYVENLLYGGNAESTTGWSHSTVGALTVEDETTSSASKYIGKKSLKITVTDIEKENARCFYRQNYTDNIKANTEYTLSAYVKTGDLTAYSDASLTGAFIQISGYDSEGNLISAVESRSQILTERTPIDVNKGWRRLSCTVTTTSDVISLRCYLILRNAEGSVCFDGIQLEKGSSANDYNMLENSNFSDKSGNVPTSWSKTGDLEFSTGSTIANGVIETENYKNADENALKITGEPGALNAVAQTVSVAGNPDDTYILSGWARGYPVNTTYHTELSDDKGTEKTDDDEYIGNALFELGVRVDYSVSDGRTVPQYKTSAKFNTTITDWQCASVPIVLKYTGGEEGKTYTPISIRIIPKYKNQENYAFFDKIMLVKDAASSYTYDKDGNLVAASSNSEQKNNMEYDEKDNLTSYTDTAGFTSTLSYYDNNNLMLTKTAGDLYTKYNYTDSGSVFYTETRNAAENATATAAIRTNNDYNTEETVDGVTINAGAYQIKYRDQNNRSTYYERDHKTGTLESVTDAKSVVTNYEYYPTNNNKAFGKQKSVSSSGSKVTYEYNGKEQLDKIIFGNTTKEEYSFDYDEFGNIKQTLVGLQPLSTNTYEENNGVLKKTEYGNKDSRRYSYNNFGQKIVDYVTDDGTQTKAYSWAYNDSGINIRHTDYVMGLQYLFDYDSLGRLSKEEVVDSDTKEYIGSTEYAYDIRNNLTNLITNYGGKAREQKYYYSDVSQSNNSGEYEKDNLPTMYKLYSSRYAIYDYDSLNRFTQRKFTLDTPLYYNYVYKKSDNRNTSGSEKYQTTQVKEEYIGDDVYIYGYDVLGNITSIKKSTRTATGKSTLGYGTAQDYVTYTYDDLGQLTGENFPNKRTSNTWNYDELGNIKKRVNHTIRTITNPVTNVTHEDEKTITVEFGYSVDPDSDGDGISEAGWNNLLTTVTTTKYLDGIALSSETENIDYDAIGNPITYLGATLTWNGRQLTGYSKGTNSITYEYDADGLRTYKNVNSATSKYYYVNGRLHYEERSNGTKLYFYYDSNGYLTGIEYDDTNYYPATNLKGDVVAIYDADGICVAKYEYDAWGKVISVIDCDYFDETKDEIVPKDITNDINSTDIAMVNPIRYRGYYYDSETELYYLQSRYYNAEVGRFLNSDSISDSGSGVLGYNTFIYCANNPVNASDPSGHSIIGAIILGAAIGAVVNGAINLASQLKKNNGDWKTVNKKELGIATTIGAVSGALSGAFGFGVGELAKTAVTKTVATIIGEGLINTMVGNIQAMATGEERTLADNVTDFVQGSAISTFCTAIPVFNNNRIFNNATKSEKRSLLNNVFTNKQIRNGVTNTIEYGNYLLQGSEELTQCVGFAVTLFEEYTE